MPNLASSLIALTIAVERAFTEGCRAHGLTSQQGHLLCLLVNGPVRLGELGSLLELEKSSLSGLVNRIEKRGLACRERDPHDRRGYTVALTAEGTRTAHAAHRDVTRQIDGLTDHLSDADRDRLESLVNAVIRGPSTG